MARTARFSDEEVARARELRDKATTVMELRKALSVLLIAEAGLDASRTWELMGISEGAALVEKLGRSIPMSTTYRLLARHGWRKVQPDTKHPKSKPVIQEEFKKTPPGLWQPPAPRITRNRPSGWDFRP